MIDSLSTNMADENYGEISEESNRIPCAIVVDVSGSMDLYMDQVNEGLRILRDELQANVMCQQAVDTTIITFSEHARIVDAFRSCMEMRIPELKSEFGGTAMYEAIELALKEIRKRVDQYVLHAITYRRAWIFLLTDGFPTDSDENGARVEQLLKEAQEHKLVNFYPFAIGNGCDEKLLAKLNGNGKQPEKGSTVGVCFKVNRRAIRENFKWTDYEIELPSRALPGKFKIPEINIIPLIEP